MRQLLIMGDVYGKETVSRREKVYNPFKVNKQYILRGIVVLTIFLLLVAPFNTSLQAASAEDPVVAIGDITRIKGIRENQLMGMGLVIGLNGTGDSNRSQATIQMVANMLTNLGIEVTPNQIQSRNLAAVMTTATLPAFAYTGDTIDVTLSALGDAQSLQGGTLLMTPLRAANGEIFAVAQGPVSIGGYNLQQGGNQVRLNHPNVARIPNGAIVERELEFKLDSNELTLLLENPSFETAGYIAQAINENFKYLFIREPISEAIDAGQVKVTIPPQFRNNPVEFIARISNFEVRSSMKAKIIINERTGTIVMGHNVRISTVFVAHGNLTVTIRSQERVSQPTPLSGGETVVTKETEIEVSEEDSSLTVLPGNGTVQDLVSALNAIGATPRDIIAIIQLIKAQGALHAELELI